MYPSIPRYAIGKHRRVHSGEGYTNCVLGPVNRETVGVGIRNGGVICVYGAVRESCSQFIIALVSSYILPETDEDQLNSRLFRRPRSTCHSA